MENSAVSHQLSTTRFLYVGMIETNLSTTPFFHLFTLAKAANEDGIYTTHISIFHIQYDVCKLFGGDIHPLVSPLFLQVKNSAVSHHALAFVLLA